MSSHSFRHFDSNRLPDPHLTSLTTPFSHVAHHDSLQLTQHVGGLKPPPVRRLRRANNPSSSTQHRFKKLYLHCAPLHVRDTPSQLLQASPPARPATVLNPSQGFHLGVSLSPPQKSSSFGTRFLTFHARAADQAHAASMPDTTWPVSGHPPDSSQDRIQSPGFDVTLPISTRQQRIPRRDFQCNAFPIPT
jgi:hypothetical protein